MSFSKLIIIGWDSAPPRYLFREWRESLPHLSGMMSRGWWGELESTIPPITCPAWMSMVTSKNPGRLGFYGFRNRKDYSYDGQYVANSTAVREDTLWDILSRAGKRCVLVGVPQTYPPRPVNGWMVADFLTPSLESRYTFPAELREEIKRVVGRYMIDVENFRTEDKARLLAQIYEMTDLRFRLLRHLLTTREWDFCMMVEMGPDRIQHGFWKFFDPAHPSYQPGSPFAEVIRDYYVHLDRQLGEIREMFPEAALLVVSDHGAKGMAGGVCFNEWLIQQGYLTLRTRPERPVPLEKADVDWGRTLAWGSGGYYGRLNFNIRGREPQGVIDPADLERVRAELIGKIENMLDHEGKPLGNQAYRPEEVYSPVNNIPPDLIVYFGDLSWRSVGSVGMNTIYTFENDTGPDDANHDRHGIFVLDLPGVRGAGALSGLHLMDVAPTALRLMDQSVPEDMEGQIRT